MVGLVLLGFAGPIQAQIKGTLSPQQEWEQLKRQSEAEVAGLPVVKVDSIREVMSFSIDSDMLTARPLLASSNFRDVRIVTPDLPGYVRVKQFVPVAMNGPSLGFQFVQVDLTSAAAGQINTMLSMAAGRFSLSRDTENGQTLRSIQLTIDPPAAPGMEPEDKPVRFQINQSSLEAPSNEIKIQCQARTFIELRFNNRTEVDAYLRPIIRSLGQERVVFAVPKNIAWQVLGRDEPVDPLAATRVKALVEKLGVDDFRIRRTAIDELNQMGQNAIWILAAMDRNKLSLQQSAEVDSLLAHSAPLPTAAYRGLDKDIQFLLDVLYGDDAALRASAAKHLQELTGKPINLDPKLDPDARATAIAHLREQLVPTTQPVSK